MYLFRKEETNYKCVRGFVLEIFYFFVCGKEADEKSHAFQSGLVD